MWEHYSSVRNIAGPHTGLLDDSLTDVSPATAPVVKKKASNVPPVASWRIEAALESLPYLADRATVSRVVEEAKGDIDLAVSKLLNIKGRDSFSSTPGSSSVERDDESDDDGISKPAKKQDRRMSRATRQFMERKLERQARDLAHRPKASDNLLNQSTISVEEMHPAPKYEEIGESEDECWIPSKRRASISATSSADEFKPIKPRATGSIRPKTTPINREEAKTEFEESKPVVLPSSISRSNESGKQVKAKRLTARDKKDQKKASQKAARKERSVADASGKAYSGKITLTLAPKRGKENNPAFASVIKTLFI